MRLHATDGTLRFYKQLLRIGRVPVYLEAQNTGYHVLARAGDYAARVRAVFLLGNPNGIMRPDARKRWFLRRKRGIRGLKHDGRVYQLRQ